MKKLKNKQKIFNDKKSKQESESKLFRERKKLLRNPVYQEKLEREYKERKYKREQKLEKERWDKAMQADDMGKALSILGIR